MPRSFLIANKRYRKKLERKIQAVNETAEYDKCQDKTESGLETVEDQNELIREEATVKSPEPGHDVKPVHNPIRFSPDPYLTSLSASTPFSLPTRLPSVSPDRLPSRLPPSVSPERYPIGWSRDEFYPHSFRTMLPTDSPLLTHGLHHTFLPSPPTDINFNRLNDLVDKVFDGLRVCDIYTCTTCGKQYSTPSNLARHKQIHRDMNDKKARKCPHCEKIYVSMPAFSMHVRTHNEGCACPYCGKRFSRPWLLQGHIRTHTGEKPFKCNLCPKAFADKSNLRAHIQTHSTEKPYVCGRCGKAFALKSYLSKHEESSCMKGLKYHKLSCAFNQRNN